MHPFYKNISAFCDYLIYSTRYKMHHFVANKFQKYRSSIIKTRILKLTALKKGERRERWRNNFNKNVIKSLMLCYSPAITTHLMMC